MKRFSRQEIARRRRVLQKIDYLTYRFENDRTRQLFQELENTKDSYLATDREYYYQRHQRIANIISRIIDRMHVFIFMPEKNIYYLKKNFPRLYSFARFVYVQTGFMI
jgi:hypothetical protein